MNDVVKIVAVGVALSVFLFLFACLLVLETPARM